MTGDSDRDGDGTKLVFGATTATEDGDRGGNGNGTKLALGATTTNGNGQSARYFGVLMQLLLI